MKTMIRWGLVVAMLWLVVAIPAYASELKRPAETLYQKTLHATAMVVSEQSQGTGWVINKEKKQLITCQHVVGQEEKVTVIFPAYRDGRVIPQREFYKDGARGVEGRVVSADARRDLALVVVDSLPDEATELKLALDAPGPGEEVHAVGAPGESIGLWVYSYGKVRIVTETEWTDQSRTWRSARVVETQLPLNPGDSGGPLVNDDGELIGVNSGRNLRADLMSLSIEVSEVKAFLAEGPQASQPRTAEDFYRLALKFRAESDWQNARENLEKAIEQDPAHLKALTELIWVLNELGEYEEAIKISQRALQIDETNAVIWRELGYALLKQEHYRLAAQASALAVKLAPTDVVAWEYLAAALDGLGEKDLAEQARKRARQLAGEDGK